MAKEFRLPDIGEGLTEAEIVRWLIPVGGAVKADQPVVEVETDKAVVEIPSPFAGFVIHHGGSEGQTMAVGEVLLVVGEQGEVWPANVAPPVTEAGAAESRYGQPADEVVDVINEQVATDEGMPEPGSPPSRPPESPPPESPAPQSPAPQSPKSESAKPIVGSLSEDAFELAPRHGRVASALSRAQALPLVRKLARDLGVDLEEVTGSGPDGRIVREDVLAVAEARAVQSGQPFEEPPRVSLPPMPVSREGDRRPMSKLRRTIAANMKKSWNEIPHVTTFDQVDASRLLAARKALENRHKTKVPLEALVIKAVVPVLAAFPEFNSRLDGDDLVVFGHYDIGVAVDTPDGLLVAVVKTADQRTLLEVAADVRRLAEGARERKLNPGDLSGQTFTISNIGALGGGFGTPLVPPGTTAILSVGKAVEQPVAADGKVVIAPLLPLSLSYDHRVIDGGLGRRFMAMVLENLAEPTLFLA
ncbi:MAG TPA: dihydrolipoamide acetyltransferase family protein [Acidimicrobiia bacterium]|nr:dihydrolipoamide acetyltransferase family protein [Acidimicrobiia bacterium]